jgi:Ca2+-binding RTX toxin-like protein
MDGTPTDGRDPWIDSLAGGGRWSDYNGNPVKIQWTAFQGTMDGANSYAWTPVALAGLRDALSLWENVANIDFVEVTGGADADVKFWWGTEAQAGGADVLGWSDLPGYVEYYKNPGSDVRDVLFNAQDPSLSGALDEGGLGLVTMVHEIGHLLGLAHPHDGGADWYASLFPGVNWWAPGGYGDGLLNQGIYTTMSYNFGWPSEFPDHTAESWGLTYGPMALDIAAIQTIYGTNSNHAAGDDVYTLPTVNGIGTYWSAIWDTDGVDTISNAGSVYASIIDLNAASWGVNGGGKASYGYDNSGSMIVGGYTIARGVVIENAIGGGGQDTITGNSDQNRLEGRAGDDVLDGGADADTMIGGAGDDTYYVDDSDDVILEFAGGGSEFVYSSAINYTLGENIEDLHLTGTGLNGTGNSLDNVISGNERANILNGGGGADTLSGFGGNDRLVVNDLPFVFADGGEGVDTLALGGAGLVLDLTYPLTTAKLWSIERIDLTGTGNNTLIISQGSVLGGIGTFFGGAHVLVVEGNSGDKFQFAEQNWIQTGSINYVEGMFDRWVLGNAEVHVRQVLSPSGATIVGTAGNDIISTTVSVPGQPVATNYGDTIDGGAGNDRMAGGSGNDTYYVDTSLDDVIEGANGGRDKVFASASYVLGASIEDLTLIGAANINAMGNDLSNVLAGNTGNNVLDGGGGADAMAGGLGDDTYYVDTLFDVVTEAANAGQGKVVTSLSYVLGANVEDLALTGMGNVDAIGNALNNVLAGNAGKNVLDGSVGDDSMAGGLGDDTYYVDTLLDVVVEEANAGRDKVVSSVSYVLGANVEDLTLAAWTHVNATGNALNNALVGNAGNNVLDGGGGDDTMAGGQGDDSYYVDTVLDVVVEAANAGRDRVFAGLSHVLGANVENLTLTGTASIDGTGNALANSLIGNAGNNTLDGGGGNDTMAGGLGDDTYVVDAAGDVVTESVNEGTDAVNAWLGWTLGDNLENLKLMGTAHINGTGNDQNNALTGNSGKNFLSGAGGDDTLDGGTGADAMAGGLGDDTYVVDSVGDLVTESAGEGTDTVNTWLGWTLGANLEQLRLMGLTDLNGTGNALDNVLFGNTGKNVLDGSVGADSMRGGAGDDTYVIDNVGDVAIELAGDGMDTVLASINWTLGSEFEKLTLTGTAGISGTGNELANALTGNGGNNMLDGGADADTMAGGIGDDTYVVDNAADVVTELAGGGGDTVLASISWMLGANVERLTLTGIAHLAGTGNELANVLTGNAGNNVLDGGAGVDMMAGGMGDDTYVVDVASEVVTEVAGEGTDTVESWLGWTLGANFEQLRLLGTADLNGTGNNLDNALFGNSGKNVLNGGVGADKMSGGLGDDTYIVDQSTDVVVEAAGGGTDLVQASVSFQLGANVEKLVLTGNGSINGTGNELADVLTGNGGKNVLDGGAGADTMVGGAGDDSYVVDNAGDVVTELAGGGGDTVLASINWTLGANLERLTLTGVAHVAGTGNELANTLTGNAGNNLLDGGLGADTMAGGLGDDTYVVDVAGDVVTEAADQGTDTVNAWVGWTLGANLEQLRLLGIGDLNGTGNGLNNTLWGNAGKNLLDGKAGTDTMAGGLGDDTYIVDQSDDVVVEAANAGTDLVQSSAATYQLGVNVENLVLLGKGSINGTGNLGRNELTGNAGNNVLDGGAGADTMVGGAGNDTYIVNNVGDVVTELAGGGGDTVIASLSWTLGANLEKLTLTGVAALAGTGNELNNTLTGNAGANTLDGGLGADTMAGGLGNDIYVADQSGDIVVEVEGEGIDLVRASVSYTLSAHVEKLSLEGTADLRGTGNDLANTLTGNAGNNVLDGKAGADTMIGGLGDDTYIVDDAGDVLTEAASAGIDTVQSSVTWRLKTNFEKLILTGTADLDGTGNELANVLTGNAGINLLDGGLGADTMAGGLGNDTYIVDNAGDVVVEGAAGGSDTIRASVTYGLQDNLETLVLVGKADLNGTGNAAGNTILGNAGNNILDGGAGADRMEGGLGNDTYIVDNAGDLVVEAAATRSRPRSAIRSSPMSNG